MQKTILLGLLLVCGAALADDPIEEIQQRVMHAWALTMCLADSTESVSTYEHDLRGAFYGLADLLQGIQLDLDPDTFREKVLKSEAAESEGEEVGHG
jgi:hypothetical protein